MAVPVIYHLEFINIKNKKRIHFVRSLRQLFINQTLGCLFGKELCHFINSSLPLPFLFRIYVSPIREHVDGTVLFRIKQEGFYTNPMIVLSVLRNHKIILKMVISGFILPDGIFRGKHGNITLTELFFNLFAGNDPQPLVKWQSSGPQAFKVFLCLFAHIAVLGQVQFINTVVKLFRCLFKKSLPLLNQLRHLAAVLPDYSGNDNQDSEDNHSQYKTGLIKLAVHGLHDWTGILFYKQIP